MYWWIFKNLESVFKDADSNYNTIFNRQIGEESLNSLEINIIEKKDNLLLKADKDKGVGSILIDFLWKNRSKTN